MKTFILTATKENQHQLAINGTVIPEEVLEDNKLEWDDREGYIEHLEECAAKDSYGEKEKEVAKTLSEDILLIARNSLGAQEMIHPQSTVFGDICQILINQSEGK